MVEQVDVRSPEDRGDDERRSMLHAMAEAASAARPYRLEVASFDAGTGNPAVVVSHDSEPGSDDYVARALAHVQGIGRVLGLAAEQPPEYLADPAQQSTSAGAVAVHLRQAYKGIPIYDAAETVRFDPDGRITEVAGRSHTVAGDVSAVPARSAVDALRLAAEHLARGGEADDRKDPFGEPLGEAPIDLTGFAPVVRSVGADRPDLVTSIDAPPFPHAVTVSLVWFPLGGGLRLGWHLRLRHPDGPVYRLIVDAADGTLLLCKRLTQPLTGRADVVLTAGQPRRPVTFPLPLASYGAPVPAVLPAGFPDDWLLSTSTQGASVRAAVVNGAPVNGSNQGGEVVFATPGAGNHPDDLVVNLFALCSVMHDVLYLLGFREDDGNFQVDNHGRGGRAGDPVIAVVHPGRVWGTANMGTPADGNTPLMNMGLVTSTNRHTALDPDVVYHEYTHGLTNRLVGGPMNDTALDEVQSGGMGEGWSDFVACIMQRKAVVGDWVVGSPLGIRDHAYDETFPDTFADLGSGRYVGDNVHAIGEIWCATLMSLSRRLGPWPTAQIVVDALKLTSANPSFLAARDAILLAAGHYANANPGAGSAADVVHTVWEVFARYGMGTGARTNGATLTGIVGDFEAPPRPSSAPASVRGSATPGLAIPDNHAAGVRSPIALPDAGPIVDLSVTVDVTHPYRGDLLAALVGPDGRRVVLHERSGGRADDLHQTWHSGQHAGLAALRGMAAGGTWSLTVADVARADEGVFDAWAIEAFVGETRRTVEAEVVPGLVIPDEDSKGIATQVSFDDAGTIAALALDVDITHSFIGDLEVTLAAPDRRKVKVHTRGGGDADNLIATYLSDPGAPLAPFVGTSLAGTWTLTVSDNADRDVGKLNRWRLRASL